MSHYGAILWKQWKDIFRNKTILIQFVMFPVLTVIMENAVKLEGMPEHFFACLFGVMYLGMAPFTSVAAGGGKYILNPAEVQRMLNDNTTSGGESVFKNILFQFNK